MNQALLAFINDLYADGVAYDSTQPNRLLKLEELLVEAWADRAPKRLAKEHLTRRFG